MGPIGMPELIILLVMFLLPGIALVSCLKSNFQDPINKLVWVVVIVFLPFIGWILYFTISPKQRIL